MSPIRNILVLYHRGVGDEATLERAVSLTRKVEGSLIVAEALDPAPPGRLTWLVPPSSRARREWDQCVAEREAHFERLTTGIRRLNVPVRCRVLADGPAHDSVIRAVIEDRVDLVILTAPMAELTSTGVSAGLVARLMRDCPCPVWLAHPGIEGALGRVAAAVALPDDLDGDHGTAERVLALAGALQSVEGCTVDIVHAWDFVGTERDRALSELPRDRLDGLVRHEGAGRRARIARLISDLGLDGAKFRIHVVRGEPDFVIPEFADQHGVDLVVMGSGPGPALGRLFASSAARRVSTDVACSVLAVGGAPALRPHSLA